MRPAASPEQRLCARLADAVNVWYVVYPRSRGDAAQAIEQALAQMTHTVATHEFANLQIEQRQWAHR